MVASCVWHASNKMQVYLHFARLMGFKSPNIVARTNKLNFLILILAQRCKSCTACATDERFIRLGRVTP